MTSVDFRWGDDLKIIEQVPAEVCEQCGEKYFPAQVYKDLERLVNEPSAVVRHHSVDVLNYSTA
jgi:YgiT-type zinc finger domain-containing protein